MHLIAIYRLAADKQPFSLFVPLDAGDLFGDVLCVHVVHNGPERRDLVGDGVHTGVNAVQQGDVPHTVFREIALHIVAGHDVVAPQPGQILGNHHVHPSGLNVPQHPPELRAVETGARPAVVRKCQEKTERLFDFFSAPEKHRSFLVYPKHWSPPVFTIDQK